MIVAATFGIWRNEDPRRNFENRHLVLEQHGAEKIRVLRKNRASSSARANEVFYGRRPMSLEARVHSYDLHAFAADLDALHEELKQGDGADDLAHLRKVERWGRMAVLLGYATAWIAPNPISVAALSLGIFVRWTGVAHPVLHRGYDRFADAQRTRHSKVFASGHRRLADWFDWISPAAWTEEHNIQHHYRLNEEADPDLVERNLAWLREAKLPRAVKLAIVPVLAAVWKWLYYAPNTLETLDRAQARRRQEMTKKEAQAQLDSRWSGGGWSLLPSAGTSVWLRSWLPYIAFRFILLPVLFLPLGQWAMWSVLVNSVLAELLTNLHAFATIVPSHAAEDLYRFEGRAGGRPEFYLRQIRGSANYRTGGDFNDLMHGWLNYQIEHHLFPDLSLLSQQKAAPRVREICQRHGIEYIQESVWIRLRKTVDVIVGSVSMRRWESSS